jgi:hypothetical protein
MPLPSHPIDFLELPQAIRQRLEPGQTIYIDVPDNNTDVDPTMAWLQARIASAPTDPSAIREAEEDMSELMRNMNANRAATGERIPFPEVK